MTTFRSECLYALLLAACAPTPGEPCEPGSDVIPIHDPAPCGGDGLYAHCGLSCTGSPGCDGPADFSWVYASELSRNIWCGCDGETHYPVLDYGGVPTTRWQWFGPCNGSCLEVDYVGGGWGWGGHRQSPVDPRCTECRDAMPSETAATACASPDGLVMPAVCCDCASAERAPDGACMNSELDLEIADVCCR